MHRCRGFVSAQMLPLEATEMAIDGAAAHPMPYSSFNLRPS